MASPFILLLLLLLGSCEKSQQRPVYSYSGWTKDPAPLAAPLAASAHLRGFGQSTGPGVITFNTKTCPRFGFLHYVELDLGTPKKKFWGVVDTGSSQIWVPGESHSTPPSFCVPKLNTFIPEESSTSSNVPWGELCEPAEDGVCGYIVNYESGESSSGYLVEDVLHLPPHSREVSNKLTRVPFGRELKRIGNTKSKAPNGVAGLGPKDHSLADALVRDGLIAHDSFSICFGLPFDSAKLAFGDVGRSSQKTTPFRDSMASSDHYEVRVSRISVGWKDLDVDFSAAVDTGSEFTLLPGDVYNQFTRAYDSMMPPKTRVHTHGGKMPFDYCYRQEGTQVVTLTMDGGDEFPVLRPLLGFWSSNNNRPVYCLGVRSSYYGGRSIIGVGFLHGLKIVFDRQRWVLGWEECKGAKGLA